MRSTWIQLLIAAGITASVLPAQTTLRFDVASVRVNRKAACRGPWDFKASQGTLNAVNAPLRRIISRAFQMTDDRVAGPSWIDFTCYDIRAKAAGDRSEADLMRMLQTLLTERFHMVAKREAAERPVYVLVVEPGGSKLRPFGDPVPDVPGAEGAVVFMARHMTDLCERLGKVTGRPVVDRTGLTGDYQIELTYVAPAVTAAEPEESALDVFAAVRSQLGLRLESQRVMIETLKIDRIDKAPTEN